jgi:hypothetical protein
MLRSASSTITGVVHDAVQNRTVLAIADSPTVELFKAAQPSTADGQPSVR